MRMTTRVLGALIAAAMFVIAWLAVAPPALGGVADRGDQLRHQPQQPAHVPVRAGQRRRRSPAILVAVHYCSGSGPAFYSGTEFASLADRYGFIVIYPSATRSGQLLRRLLAGRR